MNVNGLLLGGGGLLVLLTLIEVAPLKLNPWKALGRGIGRAINGEVLSQVRDLAAELRDLKADVGEQAAVSCRTRILGFGDEVRQGIRHSKDSFDQVLRDIDAYERYCEEHPAFENNVAVLTIQRIKDVYMKLLDKNDFL